MSLVSNIRDMFSKALFTFLFFIFTCGIAQSQMLTEVGALIGQSYYLGDLNQTGHFPAKHTHLSWGISVRQPINARWAFKGTYFNGKLSGSDADNKNPLIQNRNLSFESPINEVSAVFEFNFLRYHSFIIRDYISPYMFGGIAVGFINPKAELNGNKYDLRELKTEGQQNPYSKSQFAIPFGVGLKFKFSHRVMFALEYGIRRTFTDYIDDVSTIYPADPTTISTTSQALSNRTIDPDGREIWGTQRGNPNKNDFYTNTSFTITVRLGKHPNLCKYNTQ